MNPGRFKLTALAVGAGVVLMAGGSATGQESRARRGRAIEFSEPRSDVVSSNVNLLGANKPTPKDLERELKKPFEFSTPSDDYVERLKMAPLLRAPRTDVKARRMREFLEKRNDWIFLSPEEMMGTGMTAEEMLEAPEFGPDGEPKKRKTPIERYYERLEKARAEAESGAREAAANDPLNVRGVEEGSGGLRELAFGQQNKLFDSVPNNGKEGDPNLAPSTVAALSAIRTEPDRRFAEVFGFANREETGLERETAGGRTARLEEFKQLLENRASAPLRPSPGAANLGTSPAPGALPAGAPGPLSGLNAAGAQRELKPFSSGATPPKFPTGPPSPAMGAAAPSWQTTPPPPEPPRTPPPQPTFSIPKRKF